MSKPLFLEERVTYARRLLNERFVVAKSTGDLLALARQALDILDGDRGAVPGEWVETCGGKSSCCMDASES